MDRAQHALGHVAHGAALLDLGEVHVHGGIAFARRQAKIDNRVARDLGIV